jgi:glycosyltransferase family protein
MKKKSGLKHSYKYLKTKIFSHLSYKNLILNIKSIILPSLCVNSIFKKITILSIDETIDYIRENKVSISRFGDGEIGLMTKKSFVDFQKIDSKLSEELKNVIMSDLDNLLICLPGQFKYINQSKRRERKFWLEFIQLHKKDISSFLNQNKIYGNTNLTRFYFGNKNKDNATTRFEKIRTIWTNRDLLIIEGEFTRTGIGNNLYENAQSISRIICPAKNAFDKSDLILECAKLYGKKKLILLALGPTATVLSYKLSKDGFWAFDIGHLDIEYMWMINKAKRKMPVIGRYVNEVSNVLEEELDDSFLKVYKSQIIDIIK